MTHNTEWNISDMKIKVWLCTEVQMYFDTFISMLLVILSTIASMNLTTARDIGADRVKEILTAYWISPTNLYVLKGLFSKVSKIKSDEIIKKT